MKEAKWEYTKYWDDDLQEELDYCECSNCKYFDTEYTTLRYFKYCPECGSKMMNYKGFKKPKLKAKT